MLRRSTPFRVALAFAGLLIVAFLVAGVTVYRLMDRELDERLDEDLRHSFELLRASYQKDDTEDLIAAVGDRARLAGEAAQFYGLTGPGGDMAAGNFPSPPVAQIGLSTVSSSKIGGKASGQYRMLSGPVGPYQLTLAFNQSENDELRLMLFSHLGWATLIAAGLAVLGGALLASRVQRRLDAISATMQAVSQGALDRRIPLIGSGDDVDQVSAQVNAALDRIVDLMEGLRQVGYDIAHDLKTPLNRLRIILEEIVSARDDKARTQGLSEAMSELDQITQTFDALLRIAQLEAGATRKRFQALDLASVVDQASDIYREVAVDEGKTLQVSHSPTPAVMGDRDLILQMLANLVENALRHSQEGKHVKLACVAAEGGVRIDVSDDGPGIPREERDKVFRRLYRMDKSRSTPGNGLGLSMVKAIADLHGAAITLEDAAPGLRVSVTFPDAPLAQPTQL